MLTKLDKETKPKSNQKKTIKSLTEAFQSKLEEITPDLYDSKKTAQYFRKSVKKYRTEKQLSIPDLFEPKLWSEIEIDALHEFLTFKKLPDTDYEELIDKYITFKTKDTSMSKTPDVPLN